MHTSTADDNTSDFKPILVGHLECWSWKELDLLSSSRRQQSQHDCYFSEPEDVFVSNGFEVNVVLNALTRIYGVFHSQHATAGTETTDIT